jgi:lipopolysaccharide/colanic/teichoic acid biosynthesis glycosyltransferase
MITGDGHGGPGDASVPGRAELPVEPAGAGLVAPITLGRPGWRRRYTSVSRAIDAGALACTPGLYLMWREVVALPLVAVLLSVVALAVAGRGALRLWLHRLRRQGRAMSTVLAVGAADGVAALVDRTRGAPGMGWRIDGACTPTGAGIDGTAMIAGVPVVGDLDAVASLALTGDVDAVAVGPAPGWTAVRLQKLAWDLDCSRTALLVDPRLVQLVGPRMRVTGVPGLPLLRLDHPTLTRVPRLVKGAMDRVGALLALLLVAPVMVSCALAVRRDGGPALRRQQRLGRGGREFALLTFRTTRLDTNLVTPVGRLLRRHCLDELPQLFNVLSGSMSLVGPRPTMPHEVLYGGDHASHRRNLLVKPGITGLWQMWGREPAEDEPEAEGVDLLYVEDWSPALDARILLRTLRTAIGGSTR